MATLQNPSMTGLENNHIQSNIGTKLFAENVQLEKLAAKMKTEVSEQLKNQIELLKSEEERIHAVRLKMDKNLAKHPERVNFNVGGTLFSTTKQTLTSIRDTFFTALLSSEKFKPDSDGYYFLDRDPTHFGRIINYLRTGILDTDFIHETKSEQLKADLNYFCIEIVQLSEKNLRWNTADRKSAGIDISYDGRKATRTENFNNLICGAIGTEKVDEFKVRIDSVRKKCAWIGFMTGAEWYQNEGTIKKGYFINLQDIETNAKDFDNAVKLEVNDKDVITVIREGTIVKILLNDLDIGIYSENVPNQKLYPAALIKEEGISFTLI